MGYPKGCYYHDVNGGGLSINSRKDGNVEDDGRDDAYHLCYTHEYKCGCFQKNEKYIALPKGSKCKNEAIIHSKSDCEQADKEVCVCRDNRYTRGKIRHEVKRTDGKYPMGCFYKDNSNGGLHIS